MPVAESTNKPRVLMVAFHFPPLAGSSGIQRTLRFVQHLSALNWEPLVLTIGTSAYEDVQDDLVRDVPEGVLVTRAMGFDTARQLALAGRYPRFLAVPDRWASWWPAAVWAGTRLIRKYRPSVIWSTYPIATAHRIGFALHRLSGLPWIADFRDPMVQDDYPPDPVQWRSFQRIEGHAVMRASYSVFTTPTAVKTYRLRYPGQANRLVLIENGYDEMSFTGIVPGEALNHGRVTLLHSGMVYPQERDPTELFRALRLLVDHGRAGPEVLRVRFRAPVAFDLLRDLAGRFGVSDMIEVLPAISYREALCEMVSSDALLVLQAANCNAQIPAKLYEYMRAKRPILALTDPAGDTARALGQAGVKRVAPLDDAVQIAELLGGFLDNRSNGFGLVPDGIAVAAADRLNRTRELVVLLDSAAGR